MQIEAVINLLDAECTLVGVHYLPLILFIALGPVEVILVEHGFQAVWIQGCLLDIVFRDGRAEFLTKHLFQLPDLHGLLPNVLDILHLLFLLESFPILPLNAHLDGVAQYLAVGLIGSVWVADALVLLECLWLLGEMRLGVVELIRGFEAIILEEVSHPLLALNLIVEIFTEFLLHLLFVNINILLAGFILWWVALRASDLRLEELLSVSIFVLLLFHAPLFEIDFIVVLFVSKLSELTTNELSVFNLVISGQVVRLFPIT